MRSWQWGSIPPLWLVVVKWITVLGVATCARDGRWAAGAQTNSQDRQAQNRTSRCSGCRWNHPMAPKLFSSTYLGTPAKASSDNPSITTRITTQNSRFCYAAINAEARRPGLLIRFSCRLAPPPPQFHATITAH